MVVPTVLAATARNSCLRSLIAGCASRFCITPHLQDWPSLSLYDVRRRSRTREACLACSKGGASPSPTIQAVGARLASPVQGRGKPLSYDSGLVLGQELRQLTGVGGAVVGKAVVEDRMGLLGL